MPRTIMSPVYTADPNLNTNFPWPDTARLPVLVAVFAHVPPRRSGLTERYDHGACGAEFTHNKL